MSLRLDDEKKIVHPWFHRAMAVGAAVSIVEFFAWARLPPIEIVQSMLYPAVVVPGDRISILRDLKFTTTYRLCRSAQLQAVFIDTYQFTHFSGVQDVAFPMQTWTLRGWTVPLTIPYGLTVYRAWFQFECFPFYSAWPIVVEAPRLTLTVVAPSGGSRQ